MWSLVANQLGRSLDDHQVEALESYRHWLITEAVRSGGIGPHEVSRIDTRHIADSLLFSAFLAEDGVVWDLGTGAGLPGIPLAILLPSVQFVLVDRSGRRIDLLNRVLRILGLGNAEAKHGDIKRLRGSVDQIVSRAALPPERLLTPVRSLLEPGGVAVVGGSWEKAPAVEGWTTEEVGLDALDRSVWFLMMRQP